MPSPWLAVGDQFLLDGADWRVTAATIARADRMNFRLLQIEPALGGEERRLLQTEDAIYEVAPMRADDLGAQGSYLEGRAVHLSRRGDVATERASAGGRRRFSRGRYAWYADESGAVAVRITERDTDEAVIGAPLAPGRIDLSFTEGLRGGRG